MYIFCYIYISSFYLKIMHRTYRQLEKCKKKIKITNDFTSERTIGTINIVWNISQYFFFSCLLIIFKKYPWDQSFPGGCNAADIDSVPGSERKWQPTSVFLPGESHGQRNLAGYSPWGGKELDTAILMITLFVICILHLKNFNIKSLSSIVARKCGSGHRSSFQAV